MAKPVNQKGVARAVQQMLRKIGHPTSTPVMIGGKQPKAKPNAK